MELVKALRYLLFGDDALLRWTLFSAFSFAAVVGLTALLHDGFGVDSKIAFLIPLILVFFANFLTMRYLVYGRPTRPIGRQFAEYSVSAAGFRILEYATYWISLDLLGAHYLLSIIVIMPTSFLLKFLFYKMTVFGSAELPPRSR